MTAEPMSIQEMCDVLDEGKRTVEQQARRIACLERDLQTYKDDRAKLFDMYRAARDALFAIQCVDADASILRDAAERVDCGSMCEHGGREWDTGAYTCSKEGSDEECASYVAQQLRELADGYDALKAERSRDPSEIGLAPGACA